MTQRVQLPDERVGLEGAVGADVTDTGFTARRIDDRYRFQFPVEVEFLASSPSGVRLRLTTDSSTIGVEVLPTHFQLGEDPGPYWSRFDLVVDNAIVEQQVSQLGNLLVIDRVSGAFDFRPGEPNVVTFTNPTPGEPVEIWLPNASIVEVRALVLDDGASLKPSPRDQRPRWVHHGSSISHCLEASGPASTWPATAARLADVHLTNLGLAGQCHLDQFTARTMRDLPADFISLKCGINIVNGDTLRMRTFPVALHGFLDTVREGHPDTPLLVVSPILCPAHEDHAGPSDGSSGTTVALGSPHTEAQGALTLRQIRAIVEQVVASRRAAGDQQLHYLDGRTLFDEADLDHLPDGLHPDGVGYVRMGERFAAAAFGSGGAFAR